MATKHVDYTKHRLLYIGPLGVSISMTVAAAVSLILVQIIYVLGVGRAFAWDAVWPPALGVFAASLLTTWIFNLMAPLLGGVSVWLRSDAPGEAMVEGADDSSIQPHDFMKRASGTSEKKACPACDTMVRADRSFCPDCGHDFDERSDEGDASLPAPEDR